MTRHLTLRRCYILFLVGILTVPTATLAQRPVALVRVVSPPPIVESQQKRIPLVDLLKTWEKNYAVNFGYSDQDVADKYVTVTTKKEKTLKGQLEQVLPPLKLRYQELNQGFYVIHRQRVNPTVPRPLKNTVNTKPQSYFAPPIPLPRMVATAARTVIVEKTITGQVTDLSTNEVLPGVNIVAKNTTIGTVTDIGGSYRLTVPDDTETLVFSSVGYLSKEVPVNGRSVIDVLLEEDIQSLSEVVVIGYGTVKKENLTGAVAQVKSEELTNTAVSSLDQALQGKAAGVQVTSINGAPGAGTSIRIRGGNSINASNEPLFVIDGFVGGGDLNSLNVNDIESMEILKDATATSIYGARGANGVILVKTKQGKAGKSRIGINSYYGIQKLPKKIDLLNGSELASYFKESEELFNRPVTYPEPENAPNIDWQDVMTGSAPISNTDISFSGGNESVKYYLSGNYFDQKGIIVNSGFKRYQTRLNLDANLFEWLTVGTTMNISNTVRNNNKINFYQLLKESLSTDLIYKEDGSYNDFSQLRNAYFFNPLAEAELVTDNTHNTRLLGNYYINASFKNGLSFRSTLGVDLNYTKQNRYEPGILPRRTEQQIGGLARISNEISIGILNENTITYIKDFGKHSINLLGGATYQNSQTESVWASGEGFNNDVLTFNRLNTGNPDLRQTDSGYDDWSIISFLGRANYTFNGKYLLTLVGRYDGSSRLAVNNKWAFFPSAAIAWNAIEEDFIKDLGVFSDLKVRASYGKTGNQAIGTYSTLPSLEIDRTFFNSSEAVAYRTGNVANPTLKWETTDQLDIGLEAGFFNGRLSFELDYYKKRTNDLLLDVEIPSQTGYSSRLVNLGVVENKGLELFVSAKPISTSNFSWDLNFNISTNKNEVIDLGGKDFVDVTKGARLIVGEPAIVFYGMVYDGTWKTQEEIDARPGFMPNVQPGFPRFKDIDGSGTFERTSDREILGSPQPDFFGGIQNSFTYKNLKLDFYFQGTYGNEIYNEFAPRLYYGGIGTNIHGITRGRWTPTNNLSDIPRAGGNEVIDLNTATYSTDVQDGSFLRLQTLRLSYSIPTQTSIPWLNRAEIYAIGNNLFTIDNYSWGFDPEVNAQGTNSIIRGYDGYTYPNNRSISLGFNIVF